MPFGQLFTSLAAVREALGNPVREKNEFSDNLYNETPFLNLFNWAFNVTTDLRAKENNEVEEEFSGLETATNQYNSSTPNYPDINNADSITIMWYLASFGTLVMFFLLISFSEVCCKKSMTLPPEEEADAAPPPYDLFAPPAYDSLYEIKKEKKKSIRKKKRKCEVFVINFLGDKNTSRALPLESAQPAESGVQPR